MNKINSKQTGHRLMSPLQSAVSIGVVLIWIGIVIMMWILGLPMAIILIVMALTAGVIGMIFFKFILDKAKFERIIIYLQFWNRKRHGNDRIEVFNTTIKQLKKHIPIEQVHPDGLIQYSGKLFGVLYRYDPPNVSSSDLNQFHQRVEYLVNSLGQGIVVSFHFYNWVDRSNQLADDLLSALNREGNTLPQKQHLYGMYETVTHETKAKVSTAYLMSIKLGKFKSADDAMKAYRSTVPGILKSMRERGIYSIQITGEMEIASELNKFAGAGGIQ